MTETRPVNVNGNGATDCRPGKDFANQIKPSSDEAALLEQFKEEFSGRVTQGATKAEIRKIRWAMEDDDLYNATFNKSFKAILRSLPTDDLGRECMQDDRIYLSKRCDRMRKVFAFTNEPSDLRKYIRLKAKLAVIDVVTSPEVQAAIQVCALNHAI
jgi:hypothetical protein